MIKLTGSLAVKRLHGLAKITAGTAATGLQEKTVVPTDTAQAVTPDGGYAGLSRVNVKAINLQAKTATPSKSTQIIRADSDYSGLSAVTVLAASLQTKAVTPATEAQTVEPDAGFYGLAEVQVAAIPFPETFKVEEVTADSDGTFTVTFENGTTVGGVVTFDTFGLPTGLADSLGNTVTFDSLGRPDKVTSSDGGTVNIY